MQIAAMSLDMAERVFQVHAVQVSGDVLVRQCAARSVGEVRLA